MTIKCFAIKLSNGYAGSPAATVSPTLSRAGTFPTLADAAPIAASLGGTVIGVGLVGWKAIEIPLV